MHTVYEGDKELLMHLYVQKLSSVWLASCKHSVMIGEKKSFTIESSFHFIFDPVLAVQADRNDNTVIYQSNVLKRHVNPIVFLIGL